MTRHKERCGLYAPDEQSVKCTRADLVSQTSRLVVHRAFAHLSAHRYARAWQQPWGVSVRQGHPWSFRVMGHRCPRRTTPLAQYRPPECDHPSLGRWQGQPICSLTQPHHLETADLQAMGACAEAHDFTRTIWGSGAWHYPGNVLRVAGWQTSLRAALLHQSVQTPGLAYAEKVTHRHRIVHVSGEAAVAGVAVSSTSFISRASSATPL
jgi:hypothetical protein